MKDRDREMFADRLRDLAGKGVELTLRTGVVQRGAVLGVDGQRMVHLQVGVTYVGRGRDGKPVGESGTVPSSSWVLIEDVLAVTEIPPKPDKPLVEPVTLMPPPNGGRPVLGTG